MGISRRPRAARRGIRPRRRSHRRGAGAAQRRHTKAHHGLEKPPDERRLLPGAHSAYRRARARLARAAPLRPRQARLYIRGPALVRRQILRHAARLPLRAEDIRRDIHDRAPRKRRRGGGDAAQHKAAAPYAHARNIARALPRTGDNKILPLIPLRQGHKLPRRGIFHPRERRHAAAARGDDADSDGKRKRRLPRRPQGAHNEPPRGNVGAGARSGARALGLRRRRAAGGARRGARRRAGGYGKDARRATSEEDDTRGQRRRARGDRLPPRQRARMPLRLDAATTRRRG